MSCTFLKYLFLSARKWHAYARDQDDRTVAKVTAGG